MVSCWTRTSGLFPPRPLLRSPFDAGQQIKTQPQGPPAKKNRRNSSLLPQRLKLQLGRPQLWRLHPGAIYSCWIWKLRTPPANPRPSLDLVRTLILRADAAQPSSRHSCTCGSNSKPRPNTARTNAAQTIDVAKKNAAKIVSRPQPLRLHGRNSRQGSHTYAHQYPAEDACGRDAS